MCEFEYKLSLGVVMRLGPTGPACLPLLPTHQGQPQGGEVHLSSGQEELIQEILLLRQLSVVEPH